MGAPKRADAGLAVAGLFARDTATGGLASCATATWTCVEAGDLAEMTARARDALLRAARGHRHEEHTE